MGITRFFPFVCAAQLASQPVQPFVLFLRPVPLHRTNLRNSALQHGWTLTHQGAPCAEGRHDGSDFRQRRYDATVFSLEDLHFVHDRRHGLH